LTRYLVVDDSPFIRKTITDALKFLETDKAEIVEAGDATDAVAQFIQQNPEVVFLDMILPGEADGVDALRAMLSQKPDAKVILITALPEDNPDVISAMSMGAFGYLRKPIRKEDVRKILRVVEEEKSGAGRIR
jgi:DNA-binding NtrC family response regulator